MNVSEEAGQAGWAQWSSALKASQDFAFLNRELIKCLFSKACPRGRDAIMCTFSEAHCCSWYVGSDESGYVETRNTGGQGRRWQWLISLADGVTWLELRCILERETLAL